MKNTIQPPLMLAAATFTVLAMLAGCDYKSTRQSGTKGRSGGGGAQTQYNADVLRSAISMLNSPERFDNEERTSKEIVDYLLQWGRMVRAVKGAPADSKTDDAETPVVPAVWQRDPLVESLPEAIRRSRSVRTLGIESFDENYDGTFLREVALLRDTANSIQPDKPDDLSVAEAFFDWTVRNIQIERPPQDDATPAEKWLAWHLPGETLYFGRGTPLSRAWVFMLLARQRGLETVLLAIPDARHPDTPRPWAVGLVSGGDIYLFDYSYGLPIPGPGGTGIATLEQAAADDAILRQMDIPGDRIYPRKAADLKKTVVLLEASPGYLSRRMKLLESHLTGRDRIVLTDSPSILAEKLKAMNNVAEVRLWTMPFEVLAERQKISAGLADETSPDRQMALTMMREMELERAPFTLPVAPEQKRSEEDPQQEQRPESREELRRKQRRVLALRIGRLLHLRGEFGGGPDAAGSADRQEVSEIVERGAKYYYLRAIPTEQELDDLHRMLRQNYELTPGRPLTKPLVDAMQQMRDDARYWLGLIWLSNKGYKNVEQFLRPLTETNADNLWTSGARYNLARSYEATGRIQDAIKLYEADRSPQQYGNRLRAERLKTTAAEQQKNAQQEQKAPK